VYMRAECADKASRSDEVPQRKSRLRADSRKTSAPAVPGDLPIVELQLCQGLLVWDLLHLVVSQRARAIHEGSVPRIEAGQPIGQIRERMVLQFRRHAR